MVGGALQINLLVWLIGIGKVLYGISAGISITAVAIYLEEIIPKDRIGTYGVAPNFGVTLGITVV